MHVLAIFGPTGIGKTAVAIALAERLRADGEDPVAVSADALQVYDALPILTGAATPEERERLEHRLLGDVPVTEPFSAGEFAARAHREIDSLLSEGRRPIVVGGTGLYLRAALAELDLRPPVAHDRPGEDLHAELARRAPGHAAKVDPADRKRLVRLLGLLDAGQELPPAPGDASALWTRDMRHPTLLAGLTMDRDVLYARIDARVDAMVSEGSREEVERAAAAGASTTARAALGFEELLKGDIEAMKRNTRRYARRQLTWMRKLPGVRMIDATGREPSDVAAEIHAMIQA